MKEMCLEQEKIMVIGPGSEINSLMIYLKNEVPNVNVIKNSPHFPFGNPIKDLFLIVSGEKLEEIVEKICNQMKASSIYRGWIDHSQVCYPICRQH